LVVGLVSRSRSTASVVLELGSGLLPPVPRVEGEFLEAVAKDPDVVDWLISVLEKKGTRSDYLMWLARFLRWTGWRPGDVFQFKREALRRGESQCEVEAQMKRFHESLRKMKYAGLTRAQAMAALYSFLGSQACLRFAWKPTSPRRRSVDWTRS